MLSRILGFLVLAGILVAIGLNFKPLLNLGQAQLVAGAAQGAIGAQNWEKAIQVYEGGLREHPRNPDIALRLGTLYQQANQPEKARQLYTSVLEASPDNLQAQLGLAQTFSTSPESFNNAVQAYRKALKTHPDSAELLTQIGNLYKTAAENPQETRESTQKWLYDQARYYYQHALKKDPKQFQTQFNLGLAYQQQQNLQPAARAYCQAIILNPNSYEARYNLGLILSELNYLDEAYRQMGQAVQLASEEVGEGTAMELAQKVQSIKNSIYNNTQKQGLASKTGPDFLNSKCLFSLEKPAN